MPFTHLVSELRVVRISPRVVYTNDWFREFCIRFSHEMHGFVSENVM